ncbi:hypothetical protein GF356_05725 [candidate division GN15 bacterium]|nr:hypothetical protein [candidate division GN15 bacterium]
MNLQISLTVEKPAPPDRMIEEIPVYHMGQDLSLRATFTNGGDDSISIEDPQMSQAVNLMLSREASEDELFMIHPTQMDATGELTAPVPSTLRLAPNESAKLEFSLYEIIPDKCFTPGVYAIYIEFSDVKSPLLGFAVEFRPQSVPLLTQIAVDEEASRWLRKTSLEWLGKLPKTPQIQLPAASETPEERKQRVEQNAQTARLFLGNWQFEKNTAETLELFERYRLETTQKPTGDDQ